MLALIFGESAKIYYRSGRKFEFQWLGLSPDEILTNLQVFTLGYLNTKKCFFSFQIFFF